MKLGHPTAFRKHQTRLVSLIQGPLTHYPGSTDELWSFTIWISCKINPGISTDFYFSLLPHSTVKLWQEPAGLDVSRRKYSASSESYFREFVSEQAFGNTGNLKETLWGLLQHCLCHSWGARKPTEADRLLPSTVRLTENAHISARGWSHLSQHYSLKCSHFLVLHATEQAHVLWPSAVRLWSSTL